MLCNIFSVCLNLLEYKTMKIQKVAVTLEIFEVTRLLLLLLLLLKIIIIIIIIIVVVVIVIIIIIIVKIFFLKLS